MSRPKTKGPVVSMRFPLAIHAKLAELAASHRQSPGVWVRRAIERTLRDAEEPPIASRPTKAPKSRGAACAHRQRALLPGGVVECRSCGAVRQHDGTWQAQRPTEVSS